MTRTKNTSSKRHLCVCVCHVFLHGSCVSWCNLCVRACVIVLSCPGPVCSQGGRGPTFTSARVLGQAPVDGPSSQRTNAEDHTAVNEVRALTPPFDLVTTACVSSPRRPGRLAHAAGHGHIMVASTSERFCLPLLTAEAWINKLAIIYPLYIVVFDSARDLRSAGRHLERTRTASEINSLQLEFSDPLSDNNSKNMFSGPDFFDANGTSL